MSGFDRSRFKGANVAANKELAKSIDSKTQSDRKGRAGYHSIDDGVNVFRICPPHDPQDPSMEALCISQLTCMVDEMKEDKKTGKKIEKLKKVFNSRIHADTPKDLVEEYIKFVKSQIYSEVQDQDEQKKRLYPITGYRGKDGKWNWGIQPMTSYVLYAFKEGKIGRLEISKTDRDSLEKLNISEDADEPITVDVFSDPDEGISLIVNRVEELVKGQKKKVNVLSKREFNPKKYKSWDEFISSERLTDEQLEEFSKQEPLKKLYRNSFTRKDFNLQLDALQMFDEKNKYNAFQNDDFLDIVEEISNYYPENSVTEQESKVEVSIDDMTREELKAYIEEKELDIIVKKAMSDEDIRDLIREQVEEEVDKAVEEEDAPAETPKKEVKEVKEDKKDLPWEKEEKVEAPKSSNADKIAAMKARMAAKK